MNQPQVMLSRLLFPVLVLLGPLLAAGQGTPPPDAENFAGWTTNGPAVFELHVQGKRTIPGPPVSYQPTPLDVPVEIRRAMATFVGDANLTILTNFAKRFDHYQLESLNNALWTNFMAHTNGRNMAVWSARSHPETWPSRPPSVQWNPTSLIWGMKGFTAISPCWETEGNPGQVPITALTRRHGYTRGHEMGPDRVGKNFAGKKVWFLTAQNTLVERTVLREVVRTMETSGRDYSILLFSADLPAEIEPMSVCNPNDIFSVPHSRFVYFADAPCPLFQTEQSGNVSASVPGFTCDIWKGGDSGSPNMLLLANELVFCNGRSTSGASPEMQADMDQLCRLQGMDPRKYQLQWVELSAYPTYSSY